MINSIIENSFHSGFSVRDKGKVRRFGKCEWHDDESFEVIHDGRGFILLKDGVPVCSLNPESEVTSGFHDDEHGEWRKLKDL